MGEGLKVGELTAYMDVDDRAYNRKLDEGGKKFHFFGSSLLKVAVGTAAAVGTALAAASMAAFNHATQLEAMGNKAATVFGAELGMVEGWAKASANAMGLTKREATGLAANFADLLIPMGFARDTAAEMSTKVVGLSGALAQWSGGTRTAAEISAILNKAIMGEKEGLKEVGISITEDEVSQRLLLEGKNKLIGAALEQAKAETTMALIFEKSKDAQAAYAAGGSKLISAKMQLKAKSKELWDSLATGLIPVLSRVTDWAAAKLGPALDFLSITVIPALTSVFSGSAGAIGEKMGALGGVLQALMEIMSFSKTLWMTAWPAIEAIVKPILDWLTGPSGMGMIKTVLDGIAAAQSIVQTAWTLAWPLIEGAIKLAMPVIKRCLEVIAAAVWLIVEPLKLVKDLIDIISGSWLVNAAGLTPLTSSSTPEEIREYYKSRAFLGGGKQGGGLVTRPGLYPLAEDSRPELVLPVTNRPRSQQLLGQAGYGMDNTGIVAAIEALTRRFDAYEAVRRNDLRDVGLAGVLSG
jgi:phage-related protein